MATPLVPPARFDPADPSSPALPTLGQAPTDEQMTAAFIPRIEEELLLDPELERGDFPTADPSGRARPMNPWSIQRSDQTGVLYQVHPDGSKQILTDEAAANLFIRDPDAREDVLEFKPELFSDEEVSLGKITLAAQLAKPNGAARFLESQGAEVVGTRNPATWAIRPKGAPEGTPYRFINTKGMSPADIVAVGDEVAFIASVWGGAAAGAALSGGNPIAAVAGGGAGGMAHEGARRAVLRFAGVETDTSPEAVSEDFATAALEGAFFETLNLPFRYFNGFVKRQAQSAGDVITDLSASRMRIKDRPGMDRMTALRLRRTMPQKASQALKDESHLYDALHGAITKLDRERMPKWREAMAMLADADVAGVRGDITGPIDRLLVRMKKLAEPISGSKFAAKLRTERFQDREIGAAAEDVYSRVVELLGGESPRSVSPVTLKTLVSELQDLKAAGGGFRPKTAVQVSVERSKVAKQMIDETEKLVRGELERILPERYAANMTEVSAAMNDLAITKDMIKFGEPNKQKARIAASKELRKIYGDPSAGYLESIQKLEDLSGVQLMGLTQEVGVGQSIGSSPVRLPSGKLVERVGVPPLSMDLAATGQVVGPGLVRQAGRTAGVSGALAGVATQNPVVGIGVGVASGLAEVAGAVGNLPRNQLRLWRALYGPLATPLAAGRAVTKGAFKGSAILAQRGISGEAAAELMAAFPVIESRRQGLLKSLGLPRVSDVAEAAIVSEDEEAKVGPKPLRLE